MENIELRQKMGALWLEAKAIQDKADTEKRTMLPEENTRFDALMAEFDQKKADVERREKLTAAQRAGGEGTDAKRSDSTDTELRSAFRAFVQTGDRAELRALQADLSVSGGYLVAPQVIANTLLKAVDDEVFMRTLANVLPPLERAESVGLPYLAADPADAAWTSELAVGTEDSTMAFGKRELYPHPLAKFIKVSNKLLRLNPSAEALVIGRLAYKFGISMEKAYLTGTGSNQPLGVFVASNDGIPTSRDVATGNAATSIGVDGLIEAKYAVKSQYMRTASWLFHRDAVKQIRKLKDGNGQYLWQPALSADRPDTILERPFYMSEYVPNTFTASLYVGLFGDFKVGYQIQDALDFGIQRLVELYALTNQTGFIGRLETDGMPVLAEAFARVKLGA